MTLNPYFLHGSQSEQGLVQDLINEHIRMFGLDVYYIPRKYIRTDNIIREVQSSSFDDTFVIEAYMNNYEGYAPGSDIMTKFGINLKNEVSLVISRERFEEFISPLLQTIIEGNETYSNDNGDLLFSTRPKEGDLVYFPLGQRLFEIKHVEFENPFYQLGKNYVYELKCELFEYEDEDINTPIEEIQDRMSNIGYITTLTLVSFGSTATAQSLISPTGVVNEIYLNNDGFGYTSSPTVTIDSPPAGGLRATAVAITSSIGGSFKAIKEIVLTNAGYGYTVVPNITISGGGGVGASATCSIGNSSVYRINITDGGEYYYSTPTVSIAPPVGMGTSATAKAVISVGGTVSNIYITNSGLGYTTPPEVTISNPPLVGFGTYKIGELVIGQKSGATGIVKKWINKSQSSEKTLNINVTNGQFLPGEIVIGSESSSQYSVKSYDNNNEIDKYNQNKDFQLEGIEILDTTEINPFGFY
jgi:hypothetical protein